MCVCVCVCVCVCEIGSSAIVFSSLYNSTDRASTVTMAFVSASALVKFWVKVFKRPYLLNFCKEEVHTCADVRYLSEVLYCTIPTHLSDLEVKVLDLEKNYIKVFGYSFLRQSVIKSSYVVLRQL